MNNTALCSECGAEIPLSAPRGLCTRCLFSLALFPGEERTEAGEETTFAPAPGARMRYFGDYELLEEIARGGMGVVFKARQVSLNRIVALKAILSGELASREERERFRKEAEGAASLQHPNIVAIHEIGQHNEQSYFSMDFVDGRTLAEVLRTERLAPARAIRYLQKIARAVAYAHSQGILHRDLKPQNILIDQFDEPRITDFGLAKRLSDQTALTRSGGVLGTPSYMSPEQAGGRNELVSSRSDVYSLGAILYEMLTGHPPFKAESSAATILKVISDAPIPPRKLIPTVHQDLETICLKCLEKNREQRYGSAQELVEELERFLNHEPIMARPAGAGRKALAWAHRNPWAVVGVASAVALAFLGLAYGLWEHVQYLKWKERPTTGEFGLLFGPPEGAKTLLWSPWGDAPIFVLVYWFFFPLSFYARHLNARRAQGLAVSRAQSAMLAASGLIIVGFGLLSEMVLIRIQIWTGAFEWPVLVGLAIGLPVLLCWSGGVWIWQAFDTSRWSGGTGAIEWVPLQPKRHHAWAFMVGAVVNLLLFLLAARLTRPIWYRDLRANEAMIPEEAVGGEIIFVFIALMTSIVGWVVARRKINETSKPTLAMILILYLSSFLVLLGIPSPKLLALSLASGVVGALSLLKIVRVRHAPVDWSGPSLSEVFICDKAAVVTGMVSCVTLILIAAVGLAFWDKDAVFPAYGNSVISGFIPLLALGALKTKGRIQEVCLSMAGGWALMMGLAVVLIYRSGMDLDEVLVFFVAPLVVGSLAGLAVMRVGRVQINPRFVAESGSQAKT